MSPHDITQIATFVHQLLEASTSTSRADGALSRRWFNDCAVGLSSVTPYSTALLSPVVAPGKET
jgi:hypothetical protein